MGKKDLRFETIPLSDVSRKITNRDSGAKVVEKVMKKEEPYALRVDEEAFNAILASRRIPHHPRGASAHEPVKNSDPSGNSDVNDL